MGSSIEKELKSDEANVISVSELINGRLYFVTYKSKIPENTEKIHFFTANDDYTPDDNSEPVSRISLGTISRYVKRLNHKLSSPKYSEKVIVNYSTGSERKRSNATVLVGVYAITNLNLSPEEAAEKLSQHSTIDPSDSLKAVKKALDLKFVNFEDFNEEDFNTLDSAKLYWVVPNKCLLFSGPMEVSSGRNLPPKRLIAYFHQVGVQTVIRLCHVKYEANPFVNADFSHYDLNISGSVPQDKALEVFLELSEECKGVVLVHCREVLGRAGCLLGAYLVKHYGLTAGEALAWIRICSCECVMEMQKTWLKNNQAALLKSGKKLRSMFDESPSLAKPGICSNSSDLFQNTELEGDQTAVQEVTRTNKDATAQLETEVRVIESAEKDDYVDDTQESFV